MPFNPNQVILDGFTQNDFVFTMFLSTGSDMTADELHGRAVSLDTTAEATVKVAADGDPIYGRIFVAEDRSQEGVTTVSVATRFRKRLKKGAGVAFNIGDTAVGAGDGLVKPAAAADPAKNVVLAVASDYVIVEQ